MGDKAGVEVRARRSVAELQVSSPDAAHSIFSACFTSSNQAPRQPCTVSPGLCLPAPVSVCPFSQRCHSQDSPASSLSCELPVVEPTAHRCPLLHPQCADAAQGQGQSAQAL